MQKIEFQGDWEFKYPFKAFEGLQNCSDQYTAMHQDEKSDGNVTVIIEDELSDSPDPFAPQINTINYILERPDAILKAVLDALHKEFPEIIDIHGERYDFPTIKKLDDYKKLFGVGIVHISLYSKDDCAYFGLECGCAWDGEHGLGFFMHKDRVLEIGGTETAFASAPPKGDGGAIIEGALLDTKDRKPKIFEPHPKYGKLKPSQVDENEMYEYRLIERGYNQEFIDLVEMGKLDININKGLSMSYLERATQFNNETIARYIVSQKPLTLKGAIHNAARYCNQALISFLLEHGVNINEPDHWGNTVLSQTAAKIACLKKENYARAEKHHNFFLWLKSKLIKNQETHVELKEHEAFYQWLKSKGAK